MITRRKTWIWLCTGSVSYYVVKWALGFDITNAPEAVFATAYWGGGALMMHWLVNCGTDNKRFPT